MTSGTPLRIARRGPHPLGRRQAARTRAAALAELLLALAPRQGSAITLTVTTKAGARRRATFSHPSVLSVIRRAIADAQAASAERAKPPIAVTPPPARRAASA